MTTVPLMPVDPIGTVLGDEVYSAIGEAILDGRLKPGQHLRDHELAQWLGVSRTPVREALQRHERTGLVEVAPHRYTRVSIPDEKLLDDTHEFAVLLLGNIVRVAAQRCSDLTLEVALRVTDAIISASAASGSGGWMLPNRNITGLPDVRACCADVTRGFDSTIAGATLRIGLTNMLTTWMFSLLPLSALMNSRSWIDETVRVNPLRSATVWTSADHCPCQPAGTSSAQ